MVLPLEVFNIKIMCKIIYRLSEHVYLFFRFLHSSINYSCTLIHWYSISSEPDPSTGLWVIQPEFIHQGMHHMGVIHLDSIVHGAHLLPRFLSDISVYWEINYTNVLDVYTSFYVSEHHFQVTFLTFIFNKSYCPTLTLILTSSNSHAHNYDHMMAKDKTANTIHWYAHKRVLSTDDSV